VIVWLYRAAWALAQPLVRLVARSPGKLGRTVRGRLHGGAALSRWAASSRDTGRPLVWFHGASVGEGRQAEAVIAELKTARPSWQVAFTFGSSSAEGFARTLPVDVAAYLPVDTMRATRAALAALSPAAVVFAATDVWPELVRAASARGVPVALVSANLGPASTRRGVLARALLRPAYAALDAVGAIDRRDADGLVELGVAPGRVRVTGDSRHDAAKARAAGGDERRAGLARLLGEGPPPVLVAGSTWPGDERVLLAAVARARARHAVRLIIAPHEPGPAALAAVERVARIALGEAAAIRRLSDVERSAGEAGRGAAWDVCVVDRVGALFDLYALARIAYVGGGFHRAGLHSVIEPAAFGVPVLFGPRWRTSRDARLLLEAGGAAVVADVASAAEALAAWLGNETARAAAGAAARAVVDEGAGAAARSAALVIALAERRPAVPA